MSRHSPHHYLLVFEYQAGHRTIYSPDFDFRFTIPISSDPNRYALAAMQIIWQEIESRLKALDAKGLPHPTPRKWSDLSPTTAAAGARPEQQENVSVAEAAELLGISEATVRRLANSGQLKAQLTPGRHRRFLRLEVETFRQKI